MNNTHTHKTTLEWAKRERRIRSLCDALQNADRNEDDDLAARIAIDLEALGCIVEQTSSGYMVSR